MHCKKINKNRSQRTFPYGAVYFFRRQILQKIDVDKMEIYGIIKQKKEIL